MADLLLTLGQMGLYYSVMLALFRFRAMLGIGTFFCALCALTFAETYLALGVIVQLGPLTYTPGSVIFFAGKLPLLLLVYVREDAEAVRQPIYGLLVGNILIVGLLILIDWQTPAGTGNIGDVVGIIADSAWLSAWGTFLLFVDCIAVILIYEKISRWRPMPLFLRLWVTVAVVLAFDHVAFFAALHLFFGVPIAAGYGGLIGKLLAGAGFVGLLWAYLRFVEVERPSAAAQSSLSDVFGILTYRQRFEALDQASRIDVLTGARNRRAFHEEVPEALRDALLTGAALSVIVVDIDEFKRINDSYGHPVGDRVLRFLTELMRATVRSGDPVYRIGGDEFVILLPEQDHTAAARVAAALAEATETARMGHPPGVVSVSVGRASLRNDGLGLEELMEAADRRLYEAKVLRRPDAVLPQLG